MARFYTSVSATTTGTLPMGQVKMSPIGAADPSIDIIRITHFLPSVIRGAKVPASTGFACPRAVFTSWSGSSTRTTERM